jgi:hypothetical protein
LVPASGVACAHAPVKARLQYHLHITHNESRCKMLGNVFTDDDPSDELLDSRIAVTDLKPRHLTGGYR